MKRTPPPLRFLMLVVGGWLCLRTAVHAPGWWVPEGVAAPVSLPVAAPVPAPVGSRDAQASAIPASGSVGAGAALPRAFGPSPTASFPSRLSAEAEAAAVPTVPRAPNPVAAGRFVPPPLVTAATPLLARVPPARPDSGAAARGAGRWSGSAWLLLRSDGRASLAEGGTLGGSQAGLRIGYRLGRDAARPLTAAARLYAPIGDREAAEAALGLHWRPRAGVPVQLALERRQALGPRGRSAFAAGVHGGVSGERVAGGLRLDAYAQAGIVGTRARDLYADGSARVAVPAGPVEVGAAVAGGAQPEAARLDAGPVLSLRLPEARLRVSAEWRFRIAGDARPGSGPALTIGTDF